MASEMDVDSLVPGDSSQYSFVYLDADDYTDHLP